MSEQKQQEFPIEEFVQETHITVGELLMQNRMANKIVAKLRAENAALKQELEEKEIGGLNLDDDKKPELNLDKEPEKKPST